MQPQWFAINLTERIQDEDMQFITLESLIEILRYDSAEFNETNIKMMQGSYWITLDHNFSIDLDAMYGNEDSDYQEIVLLLEDIKKEPSEEGPEISNSLQRMEIKMDNIQSQQNQLQQYIYDDFEVRLKDLIDVNIGCRLKEVLREFMAESSAAIIHSGSMNGWSSQNSRPVLSTVFENNTEDISPHQQKMKGSLATTHTEMKSPEIFCNESFQIYKTLTQEENAEDNRGASFQDTNRVGNLSVVSSSGFPEAFKTESNPVNPPHASEQDAMFGQLVRNQQSIEYRQTTKDAITEQPSSQSHGGSTKDLIDTFKKNDSSNINQLLDNAESKLPVVGDNQSDEHQNNNVFDFGFPNIEQQNSNNTAPPVLFQIDDSGTGSEIQFFQKIIEKNKKKDLTPPLPQKESIQAEVSSTGNTSKIDESLTYSQTTISRGSTQLSSIPSKVVTQVFPGSSSIKGQIQDGLPPNGIRQTSDTVNSKENKPIQKQPFSKQQTPSSQTGSVTNTARKILEQVAVGAQISNSSSNYTSKTQIPTSRNSMIESKLSSKQSTQSNQSISKSVMYNENREKKKVKLADMTIMYSEPLVKQHGNNIVPAIDPVDYETEILKLSEFLNETNKEIKLDIVVATLDNLEKALNRDTQILHFMCHGDYDEKEQTYYLALEDSESKLDMVTSTRFQDFFKNKNNNVKLVFFNACHSEEVGKIFQEAGVPFVIAVQSDLKIEDKAALTFSSSFYMNIFSGQTVSESFESARSSLQAKQHEACFTCCCAHSHDDNCLWYIEAMSGYDIAHESHRIDSSRCKCPNAIRMWHEFSCEWANEFLQKYRDNAEDYIDEANGGELFVCCCHTHSTPHDESLKFRLIRREDAKDFSLMGDLPEGNVITKSKFDFNHPIFQDQSKLFGRNLEIFKVYKPLMMNSKIKMKFILLYGDLGSGKTAVAKKVARHLKERGQIDDVIVEDFEKMKSKITKFEQKMRLGQHNKETAFQLLKNSRTLFILDNCDDIIQFNKTKFEATLNELASNTSSKFIIISHDKHDLKLGKVAITSVHLGDLQEYYVKQLLDFYVGETLQDNFNRIEMAIQIQELIKIMPKSPKNIMETVQNINEKMDISQILYSFQNSRASDKEKDYTAFNLLMKELKSSNQKAYDMLLLVSLFPHGVSVEDLKILERKKKIPHDWIKIMESLTMFTNETMGSRVSPAECNSGDAQLENGVVPLHRQKSRRTFIQNKRNDDENMEEDDFDNDALLEESHRFKKFKNGQYFWMSITRKLDIVFFRIKKFVVEQLKQSEYRDDIFNKEILILEYLSTFSKKLLKHLKAKSHHQEHLIEYCSLSYSGIFGARFQNLSEDAALIPSRRLTKPILHTNHHLTIPDSNGKRLESVDSDEEYSPDIRMHKSAENTPSHIKMNLRRTGTMNVDLDQVNGDNKQFFQEFSASETFKLHEGNFYSYLNVEDHSQIIAYINSKECDEKKKVKIKKNIEDLCVNIPSIHKLLDEVSTCEEQCEQAFSVLNELLKNTENSQFLLAKTKLIFLKTSLYIDKFIADGGLNGQSFEDIVHIEELNLVLEEIDTKFKDFDHNEIFTELLEIEKQFAVFFLIFKSFKSNKDSEIASVLDTILKINKDPRQIGIRGKINQMLEGLIPELITRIQKLINKESQISESKKDIRFHNLSLEILESKIQLLYAQIELEVNKSHKISIDTLKKAIHIFEKSALPSLRIQTKMAYCKKTLIGLKSSRDTQIIIQLKKEMIEPAITLSKQVNIGFIIISFVNNGIMYLNNKQWKLTSLEADCKKILGEINDKLQHISSNVFQFMKAAPLMMDKNTPYGHIIRLNQSFKSRVTEMLSQQGKELNLKFEIQTIKHFKECLQRGSKFMSISCDEGEDDGIVVEEDSLPLMRKYKEQEMEDYYKKHYEEFGNIEILMLCSPNGIKLKEMFLRIIEKVNQSIRNPSQAFSNTEAKTSDEYDLRKIPTIIAFQFKENNQKEKNATSKKRMTKSSSSMSSLSNFDLQESKNQKSGNLTSSSKQQSKKDNGGKKADESTVLQSGGEENDFEDFYVYYLKEFATQQFQFEFLNQLLSDEKQEQNSLAHIKKAFSKAQSKMVTEVISICGDDIRDEQSFEEILGKGPMLFLSEEWKDSKYEFRKGQVIDITSERPPQNIDRTFLRISGRKQDIYILMQKTQENCVNIFGPHGIGKTIVAQQIAYLTFSRNTFSDGVYYFSMKELKKFQYDLKQYMESELGLQFSQDVCEYFLSQKNMLLIFDDFDVVIPSKTTQQSNQQDQPQPKIKFFEHIFYYINKFNIHYILITHKSLRPVLTQNKGGNISSHIKILMHYHELKQLSQREALNFLDSLIDLDTISIKKIQENRKQYKKIYEKVQGYPKKLIEEYCKKFGNPSTPKQFRIKPTDRQAFNNNLSSNTTTYNPYPIKKQNILGPQSSYKPGFQMNVSMQLPPHKSIPGNSLSRNKTPSHQQYQILNEISQGSASSSTSIPSLGQVPSQLSFTQYSSINSANNNKSMVSPSNKFPGKSESLNHNINHSPSAFQKNQSVGGNPREVPSQYSPSSLPISSNMSSGNAAVASGYSEFEHSRRNPDSSLASKKSRIVRAANSIYCEEGEEDILGQDRQVVHQRYSAGTKSLYKFSQFGSFEEQLSAEENFGRRKMLESSQFASEGTIALIGSINDHQHVNHHVSRNLGPIREFTGQSNGVVYDAQGEAMFYSQNVEHATYMQEAHRQSELREVERHHIGSSKQEFRHSEFSLTPAGGVLRIEQPNESQNHGGNQHQMAVSIERGLQHGDERQQDIDSPGGGDFTNKQFVDLSEIEKSQQQHQKRNQVLYQKSVRKSTQEDLSLCDSVDLPTEGNDMDKDSDKSITSEIFGTAFDEEEDFTDWLFDLNKDIPPTNRQSISGKLVSQNTQDQMMISQSYKVDNIEEEVEEEMAGMDSDEEFFNQLNSAITDNRPSQNRESSQSSSFPQQNSASSHRTSKRGKKGKAKKRQSIIEEYANEDFPEDQMSGIENVPKGMNSCIPQRDFESSDSGESSDDKRSKKHSRNNKQSSKQSERRKDDCEYSSHDSEDQGQDDDSFSAKEKISTKTRKKLKRQQKAAAAAASRAEKDASSQNSDSVNQSFGSVNSFQKHSFHDQTIPGGAPDFFTMEKQRSQSNSSLPSLLPASLSKNDSKNTMNSFGSSNSGVIPKSSSNNDAKKNPSNKPPKKKKKANQTGKQATVYGKKTKKKYNGFKMDKDSNSSSSEGEEDEDDN